MSERKIENGILQKKKQQSHLLLIPSALALGIVAIFVLAYFDKSPTQQMQQPIEETQE